MRIRRLYSKTKLVLALGVTWLLRPNELDRAWGRGKYFAFGMAEAWTHQQFILPENTVFCV